MFYFHENIGIFIGQLSSNEIHKHYAIQISISDKPSLKLLFQSNNIEYVGNSIFIASNVDHQLISDEIQMTILINPLSTIGLKLQFKFTGFDYCKLSDELNNQLVDVFVTFVFQHSNFDDLCIKVQNILHQYCTNIEFGNDSIDDRIVKTIKFLENNFDRNCSLNEIASLNHLSTSRFLHLFKENTHISFRRFQLWNKLVKSLPLLKLSSITATAHTCGFTDSSHYTRTFKETFGVNPKFIFLK